MRRPIVSLSSVAFIVLVATRAFAQPTLSVTPIEVPPGGTVTAVVTGVPGQAWGLGGSFSGSGLVYGGAALALGTDAVALGYGIFDPSGAASVTFKPPIGPTTPLYYLQAITAADLSFAGAQPTQSITLRPAGIFTNTPLLPQGLSAGHARIVGVAEPVDDSDAATKAYVDSVGGGVASQAAGGDLAGAYPNPGIAASAGPNIVNAINASGGTLADGRLSSNIARLNGANLFSGPATFAAGLSAGGGRVQNVSPPLAAGDAVNKLYADANFLRMFATNIVGAAGPALSLEQTGAGELVRLSVNSTTVPGYAGQLLDRDQVSIRSDGGFVFKGDLGVGVIPATGTGTRVQWYPKKAAFRAGRVGFGGTHWDDVNTGWSSFASGEDTIASGEAAFAHGKNVTVSGTSAVGFGNANTVSGQSAFAAGNGNVADGFSSATIGNGNVAMSNSSIAIGNGVGSCASLSIALGYHAASSSAPTSVWNQCAGTMHSGVFIFGDTSTNNYFASVANNEFAVRAAGGFRFRTNAAVTTGCNLPAGSGVFSCSSDRNLKSGFWTLDGEDVLRKVAAIPVTRWHFNDEAAGVTHVGPTAQDFHAAFGLGDTDTMIGYTDINGINMRAIQALDARTRDLQAMTGQIRELQAAQDQVRSLQERVAQLEAAIESLLRSRQ